MAVCYLITEVGRSFYRPYIYAHNIFDYYIADTLGSSFGTLTAMFMVILMVGKSNIKDLYGLTAIIFGLVVYEFTSIGKSNFDPHDVIATFIFGAIGILTYILLLRRFESVEVNTSQKDEIVE